MSGSSVFSDGELLEAFSDHSDPASHNTVAPSMAEEPPVDDSFCTFQIGNFLYRISSDFFNESLSVKPKIQQAQALGGGTSDGRPIVVSGITSHEMDCLLDVAESRNSRIPFRKFDTEVGRTALDSAIKFGMNDFRSHVISLFEVMDPPLQLAQKLQLADEFGIKTWLESVYLTLCQRGPPPSDEEGIQLGVPRCLAIWRLRHQGHKDSNSIEKDPVLETSQVVTPVDGSDCLHFVAEGLSGNNPIKHPIYYFPHISLQIEGRTQRLPRYLFAEDRLTEERLRDASERISTPQIERLLDAVNTNDATAFAQLEPALEAAHALSLRSIKSHLIRQIEALKPPPSPSELISLADRCAVRHWLKPQYALLCRKEEPLTVQEAIVLGTERAISISRVREKRLRKMIEIGLAGCGTYNPSYNSGYRLGRGSVQQSCSSRQLFAGADASGQIAEQLIASEHSLNEASERTAVDDLPGEPVPTDPADPMVHEVEMVYDEELYY